MNQLLVSLFISTDRCLVFVTNTPPGFSIWFSGIVWKPESRMGPLEVLWFAVPNFLAIIITFYFFTQIINTNIPIH